MQDLRIRTKFLWGGKDMSAYLYLAKMKMINSLTYRFEVITVLGSNLIMMMATVFLWKTAFNGIDSVSGVNESQMVTYAILSSILSSIFSFEVEATLNENIREGNIAIDLLKPINLIGKYFAQDIGGFITNLVNKLLPLTVIVLLFIKILPPVNFIYSVLFGFSLVLCYLLLWSMDAIFGIMTFWLMDIGNLVGIKNVFIKLLSGSVIPIWFFPNWLQNILSFLPFQYTYQTCLSIYIGKLSIIQAIEAICIQGIWVFLLMMIVHLLWKKARKSVQVQGG